MAIYILVLPIMGGGPAALSVATFIERKCKQMDHLPLEDGLETLIITRTTRNRNFPLYT